MKYLEGETIICDMLCLEFSKQVASTGKVYYSGKVGDKESTFPIKVWNVLHLEPGKVYHMSVQCKSFNGKNELHVNTATEIDANVNDFVRASATPLENLISSFQTYVKIAEQDTEIREFMKLILTDDVLSKLVEYPAGLHMHQDYYHGLLEHVINVTRAAESSAESYQGVDVPLLIAACLLHDVGKVYCMDYENFIPSYNATNSSADHLMYGFSLFSEALNKISISHERKLKLLNCVASHHSTMNGWTGTKPACVEAVILSYCDGMDAICSSIIEDIKEGANYETTGSRTRIKLIKE